MLYTKTLITDYDGQLGEQCLASHSGYKLDGVGPVENRPSTNFLHHFFPNKEKEKWHITHDKWHMDGVNVLSKIQLTSSYGLEETVF